jgi:S-adenosylmethionine:tRNA ribosyltransferase-isomerase
LDAPFVEKGSMRVDLFDFELPEELIALRPARPRDSARLLHVPAMGGFEDLVVRDAPKLFRPGDLLVFNDTRVIPARLSGVRVREESSVSVEATLIERTSSSSWIALAKPGKRLREGDRIRFGAMDDRACLLGALDATVRAKGEDGAITLAFDLAGPDLDAAIAAAGVMPLPPYIAAKRAPDDEDERDYQTIYAAKDGAVAAPTAGLHFTDELMARLDAAGVERVHVTLHVGAGTFLPVKADDTETHVMHSEWREISPPAADAINRAKAEGRRVIAVGTTALRSLESAADENGCVRAEAGGTDIFITPGYRFRVVDGLWTNFHLPRSTLFMLVSAFAGPERMKAAYAHAIAQGYRFYSYGDASLLWRAETPPLEGRGQGAG